MTPEIVILAMIAAFLGLRLYSVLGRRAEHEEEPIQARFEQQQPKPGVAGTPPAADRTPPVPQHRVRDLPSVSPAVERGLRAIAAADRRFDALNFLEGANSAYRMILEAFWRGDKDELRQLCDDDVYAGFAAAIDARIEAGETMDNRLVRIEETTVSDATYEAPLARITLRFRADIAAVTRNAEGAVVAGSLDDAVETIDVWSFSRNISSPDPDWVLDETDEG